VADKLLRISYRTAEQEIAMELATKGHQALPLDSLAYFTDEICRQAGFWKKSNLIVIIKKLTGAISRIT
jgi:hypothetical protein